MTTLLHCDMTVVIPQHQRYVRLLFINHIIGGQMRLLPKRESLFKAILMSFTLTFLMSTSVVADINEGDQELQLAAGFFHAQNSDQGTITAEASYGYFLTPGWEIGIKQGLNSNLVDGGGDSFTASTIPFFQYNFHDHNAKDKIVPFLGGFLGSVWNDRDFEGTLGPIAGAKIFVYDKTFLVAQYRYEWFFDDVELGSSNTFDQIEDNSSRGNHVINVGFGILF